MIYKPSTLQKNHEYCIAIKRNQLKSNTYIKWMVEVVENICLNYNDFAACDF